MLALACIELLKEYMIICPFLFGFASLILIIDKLGLLTVKYYAVQLLQRQSETKTTILNVITA